MKQELAKAEGQVEILKSKIQFFEETIKNKEQSYDLCLKTLNDKDDQIRSLEEEKKKYKKKCKDLKKKQE